ncbi:unnamed protein product, partial [Urochloa humidicola]
YFPSSFASAGAVPDCNSSPFKCPVFVPLANSIVAWRKLAINSSISDRSAVVSLDHFFGGNQFKSRAGSADCEQAEMAGRFVFRKLSSRMSRSTSLLGAHSSASATAGEPVTRCAWVWEGTIRNHKHVPAAHHTTAAPMNSGIHDYEGSIRTMGNLSNEASAHHSTAAPNLPLPAFHGHATGYFHTLPCSRAASTTCNPTSGIPQTTALKPALVNSVGVRRAFSSSTSTSTAEWDAKLAACKADVTDWFAKKKAEDDAFLRYIGILVGSWCLIFWGCFSMLDSGSSHGDRNKCEGKNGSHCQAAASAKVVKNP